jgi:hypothetical protein
MVSSSSSGVMGSLAPQGTMRPLTMKLSSSGNNLLVHDAPSVGSRGEGDNPESTDWDTRNRKGQQLESHSKLEGLTAIVHRWGVRRRQTHVNVTSESDQTVADEDSNLVVEEETLSSLSSYHPQRLHSFANMISHKKTSIRPSMVTESTQSVSLIRGEIEQNSHSDENNNDDDSDLSNDDDCLDAETDELENKTASMLQQEFSNFSLAESSTAETTKPIQQDRVASNDNLSDNEIEFQISIQPMHSQIPEKSHQKGQNNRLGFWEVWRTGKELLALHSALVYIHNTY